MPNPPDQDDLEVEWQFDALDLRPVERWLASLPLRAAAGEATTLTAQAKPAQRLVDRYLDTEDWRLHRAGLVLRVRHRGRRDEATLKDTKPATTSGLRTRLEVTEALTGGDLGRLGTAGPVGQRVWAVCGTRPLREMFVVRTRRRPFSLRMGGDEVAEIALDDTVIGTGEQQPAHLHRIEVEMTGRVADDLQPLVEEMRTACGLQPATLSKFEAGLLALGIQVPGPPDLGPVSVTETSTIGEVAFAVLRRQLGVLLAHEPGTRLGEDIEELHDMRVATRRLRAALDLFVGVLPARAPALRAELAWLGDVLGDVRDLDVQLERMDDMEVWAAPSLLGHEDTPSPLGELRALLEEERVRARHRMLEALDSTRWTRLSQGLTALARQGPNRRLTATRVPAALVVPDLVEGRHRAVAKAARRAKRTRVPADFHRLRIRGKRLRYSLEFAAGIYGGRTERFTRQLAQLQDRLGLMQDAEVATRRLLDLATGADPPLAPLTVFAMGGVAERYRVEAHELLEKMPKHLRVLTGKAWQDLFDHMERTRHRAAAWAPASPVTRPGSPPVAPTAEETATPSPDLTSANGTVPADDATTASPGEAPRSDGPPAPWPEGAGADWPAAGQLAGPATGNGRETATPPAVEAEEAPGA